MKKIIVLLIFFIFNVTSIFGQNYTIYYSGGNKGFITIQKEVSGKITIKPFMEQVNYSIKLTKEICPLLPVQLLPILYRLYDNIYEGSQHEITKKTQSITIEGNTTIMTDIDGSWYKQVLDGKNIISTYSDGSWDRIEIEGNVETRTSSSGYWWKIVTNGNTRTGTDSYGRQLKTIVEGNKKTHTDFSGSTKITIVDGNNKSESWDGGKSWYREITVGNTTTFTDPDGESYKTIVEGNTTTTTWSNGSKKIIDKKGNNIYIFEHYTEY